MTVQCDLALLDDPVAKEMLHSKDPARLSYVWTDGTPRVIPIMFHWNGTAIAFGTQPHAPKVGALRRNPRVAITIDSNGWPFKVLLVRGDATLDNLDRASPEYTESVIQFFGEEEGRAWLGQMESYPMVRINVRPDWVAILDFQTRFPSAMGV